MLDDQQRITEAYKLVQEAAPAGWGEQLGTWAKGKAFNALGPLARGAQSTIKGQKEFQAEVNKIKAELPQYLGRIGANKSKITGEVLSGYLKSRSSNNQYTPTIYTLESDANADTILTDDKINAFIIQDYKEKSQRKKGKPVTPPRQPVAAPAPVVPPRQPVDQNREAEAIAQQLRITPSNRVRGTNVLNALAARGLELTKK